MTNQTEFSRAVLRLHLISIFVLARMILSRINRYCMTDKTHYFRTFFIINDTELIATSKYGSTCTCQGFEYFLSSEICASQSCKNIRIGAREVCRFENFGLVSS